MDLIDVSRTTSHYSELKFDYLCDLLQELCEVVIFRIKTGQFEHIFELLNDSKNVNCLKLIMPTKNLVFFRMLCVTCMTFVFP